MDVDDEIETLEEELLYNCQFGEGEGEIKEGKQGFGCEIYF